MQRELINNIDLFLFLPCKLLCKLCYYVFFPRIIAINNTNIPKKNLNYNCCLLISYTYFKWSRKTVFKKKLIEKS